jgi:hypothetical protein
VASWRSIHAATTVFALAKYHPVLHGKGAIRFPLAFFRYLVINRLVMTLISGSNNVPGVYFAPDQNSNTAHLCTSFVTDRQE